VEGGRCVVTEEHEVVPVDTVISCIGYHARPLIGVPLSDWKSCYKNEDGRIDEGLWAVGWAKRGPSGVIATNRKDSIEVVDRMLVELSGAETLHQRPDFGRVGLLALLKERGVRVTGYEEWDRIDARERAMAEERGFGAQRVKITEMEELLSAAEPASDENS
jgi:ferredoxin--NADP+ reductase